MTGVDVKAHVEAETPVRVRAYNGSHGFVTVEIGGRDTGEVSLFFHDRAGLALLARAVIEAYGELGRIQAEGLEPGPRRVLGVAA